MRWAWRQVAARSTETAGAGQGEAAAERDARVPAGADDVCLRRTVRPYYGGDAERAGGSAAVTVYRDKKLVLESVLVAVAALKEGRAGLPDCIWKCR